MTGIIRDEVAAALQEAMTDTTGAVDYSPFADDLLGALATRGLTVVREGELDAERLPLNEYGRVECICGRTVLPQNWANHLLTVSYGGRHRLARQPEDREAALRELASRWEQTIATIEYEGMDDPALAKTARIQATSRRACLDDLRALLRSPQERSGE